MASDPLGVSSLEDKQDVWRLPTRCPHCSHLTATNACVVDVPHFEEVIIMSLLCERCGYKSSEVKTGGPIPGCATRITVAVRDPEDLKREVVVSDTAGVRIPLLDDLQLDEGGLGGIYTTIEGMLTRIRDQLQRAAPFRLGDASREQHSTTDARYASLLERISDMADGKSFPFEVVISDPLSNSFVGPVPSGAAALLLQSERENGDEDSVDPGLTIEQYERTHEQNEAMGLNDLKTENYHQTITNMDAPSASSETGGKNGPNVPDDIAADQEHCGTAVSTETPDRRTNRNSHFFLLRRRPDHPCYEEG